MTDNCNGILEFDALNATNGQAGPGNFQFGVASITGSNAMTTFELVEAQDIYYASSGGSLIYTHHAIDYSSYAGTGQYIVIWMDGSVTRQMRLDNISYISACLSQSVTALAQDISVQLDATGNASIVVADIDNGSSSECGTPTLSIDASDFNCDNIGSNTVTLTADDGNGHVETATATVTVLAAVADETVTATVSEVCDGSFTTITTGSSVVGVEYYLRDDSDDSVVDGPVVGTGSGLSFNTGALSASTTFNVYGETPDFVPTALAFDGVNDYIDLGTDNRGISTAMTINMWVKTSATGVAQYIAGKYNGANGFLLYMNTSGKLLIDGRDGAGGYKSSGASITSINDGQWHYISGVIDVSIGYWGVGVDGVMETVGTLATGVTLASPASLTVGTYTTNYATISADMVNIWDFGQGEVQVQNSMNNCLAGTESGLVALMHLDEGSGTVATDQSTTAINATLINMAAGAWVAGSPDLCTVQSITSCDREMSQTVTVSVAPSYNLTASTTVCAGTSYTFPDGSSQTINTQTVHYSNLFTVGTQCDSIIETTANIAPDYDLTETISICEGDSYTFPDGTTQQNITSLVVYTSNLQTVGFSCDSTVETTLNVTTVDVAVSQNGGTLTADEAGATYQWVDCDNSNAPVGGAISQSFTPTSSGNYAVEVTVNGCTETSGCTNMVVTGITGIGTADIRVYPIPARELLNVDYDGDINSTSIYSASGALINTYSHNPRQIDVSQLSKGMYILRVETEIGSTQTRFIKQ